MKLIIGLGNPGNKYAKTRHNLGFLAVEVLADSLQTTDYRKKAGQTKWQINKKMLSAVVRTPTAILAKPQTFVNQAGAAVKKIANFYKLSPEDVLIIRDDIDLPAGRIRGPYNETGSGGHRGIESVKSALGSDKFYQLKIGVGRSPENVLPEEWVLENLGDEEWESFAKLIKSKVVQKAKDWVNG